MSYSFSARGATKVEALADAKNKMDEVVVGQPMHARDAEQAMANATTAADLLVEDDSKDVSISMNGSLSWAGEGDAAAITSVSISTTVSLVSKPE